MQRHWSDFAPAIETVLFDAVQEWSRRWDNKPVMQPFRKAWEAVLSSPGKRIRSLLVVGAWQAWKSTPDEPPPEILQLAAALEICHAFILIHDDLIDEAETRRGEQPLHLRLSQAGFRSQKYADDAAMVGGDLAHVLAMDLFIKASRRLPGGFEAMDLFLGMIADTGEGELQELLLMAAPEGTVPPDAIREVYQLKTTRYTFEVPLVLGALLGGATEEERGHLKQLAEPLGLAFQMANDLHELMLLEDTTRPLPPDLRQGVKTLPWVLWQETLSPGQKDRFAQAWRAPETADSRMALRSLLGETGWISQVRSMVDTEMSAAREAASDRRWSAQIRRFLHEVVSLVEKKNYHSETKSS